MTKKKIIRKSNRALNLFVDGGDITSGSGNISSGGSTGGGTNNGVTKQTWGQQAKDAAQNAFSSENLGSTIGGIISGVGSIVGAGVANSQIADTSDIEGKIKQAQTYTVQANNNDDLMNEWASFSPMKHVSWRDVMGQGTGQRIGNTINGAGSGALTGALIAGGPGAIIGGGIGLLGGLFGALSAHNKAKRKAKKFNRQIDIANAKNLVALGDKARNIDTQNDLNMLANFSAYGGPINIFGSGAIDYELAKEDLYNKQLNTMGKYKLSSMPNSFETPELPTFSEGGNLHTSTPNISQHGGDFSNGVTFIDNGGTHEQNPMMGVPMGVDNQGTPNLVEQGEVKFNDYIFSNRLFATGGLLSAYSLPITYANHSFADIAERLSKESSERPNDPISKNGLVSSMTRLRQAQEQLRAEKQSRQFAKRGHLFAGGGPEGIDPLLNDGEDYNLIIPTGSKILGNPFSYNNIDYKVPVNVTSNNTISTPSSTEIREDESEEDKIKEDESEEPQPDVTHLRQGRGFSWLRYAPVVGAGLGALSDAFGWTNKPDYSSANLIENATDNLTEVSPNLVSNYLTYRPLDRNYYINKLNAQAGATRRALVNQSGGNRATAMAGLLAADYNTLNSLGELTRKSEEYNQAQRERVEAFNRGTNQFNSEIALKAAIANKENDKLRLQARTAQAQLREQANARAAAARSANLTNLFDNLGAIGNDEMQKDWMRMLAFSGYFGTLSYKPNWMSKRDWKSYQDSLKKEGKKEGEENG